jgi:uncharacterized DUF497 family protein
MLFEWNDDKDAGNVKKHGVSFKEAATVFGDPLGITYNDADHSTEEARFIPIGMSEQGKLLIVAHADRGAYIRHHQRARHDAFGKEVV